MTDLFHPAVTAWFRQHFPAPTPAQAGAWPAIHAGRNVLIAAPTGSGKTLAAFLAAIDALVREGLANGLPDETSIVYVSPLKALSNDVRKNLAGPLAGIRRELDPGPPQQTSPPASWTHQPSLPLESVVTPVRGAPGPRPTTRSSPERATVTCS